MGSHTWNAHVDSYMVTSQILVTVQRWNLGKGLSLSEGCSLNIVSLLWQLFLWRTQECRREACCYLFIAIYLLFLPIFENSRSQKWTWQWCPSYSTEKQRFSSLFWDIKGIHVLLECISFSQLVKNKTFPHVLFQWKLTQLRSRSWLLGLEFVTLKTRQFSTRDALNQHKNNSLSHSQSSWCLCSLSGRMLLQIQFHQPCVVFAHMEQLGWHQQIHECLHSPPVPDCPAILCAQLCRGGSACLEGHAAAKPARSCLLGQPVSPEGGTRLLQWSEHLQKQGNSPL